ncbi:hypothetical protein LZ31DRAFT_128908 [Colletotrichum somersetense]|nr:hypothetical protein LZ31DRAFT_128908 [Colletotrichum somersetense]
MSRTNSSLPTDRCEREKQTQKKRRTSEVREEQEADRKLTPTTRTARNKPSHAIFSPASYFSHSTNISSPTSRLLLSYNRRIAVCHLAVFAQTSILPVQFFTFLRFFDPNPSFQSCLIGPGVASHLGSSITQLSNDMST